MTHPITDEEIRRTTLAMGERTWMMTEEEVASGKGYHSKSVAEVIHDLRDKRFWELANEVAKTGTRNDAANMLERFCHEICDLHERLKRAKEPS